LYFHSIITCAAVFLSIIASVRDLIDHITKGRKQESIMSNNTSCPCNERAWVTGGGFLGCEGKADREPDEE
jgi:hypothetical protein